MGEFCSTTSMMSTTELLQKEAELSVLANIIDILHGGYASQASKGTNNTKDVCSSSHKGTKSVKNQRQSLKGVSLKKKAREAKHYKIKNVEVKLTNISKEYIRALENKQNKLNFKREAQKKRDAKKVLKERASEERQMKKLRAELLEEEKERVIYSRYDFLAVLNLRPSYA